MSEYKFFVRVNGMEFIFSDHDEALRSYYEHSNMTPGVELYRQKIILEEPELIKPECKPKS